MGKNGKNGKQLEKMQEYNERSDKGAVIDSQDELDHGVCLMDPNVMGYQKK